VVPNVSMCDQKPLGNRSGRCGLKSPVSIHMAPSVGGKTGVNVVEGNLR
jgi:hypothetical protein